ncbi:hypothetical protein J6590_062818 [Homalodisca vitripennis]|nr:hypothetical protein J6590_062818 [Homalodisca vitripennis]
MQSILIPFICVWGEGLLVCRLEVLAVVTARGVSWGDGDGCGGGEQYMVCDARRGGHVSTGSRALDGKLSLIIIAEKALPRLCNIQHALNNDARSFTFYYTAPKVESYLLVSDLKYPGCFLCRYQSHGPACGRNITNNVTCLALAVETELLDSVVLGEERFHTWTESPMAQCSEYNSYRAITGSSNVERGCCLDGWPAERSCPYKQLACPAIGGGSEVTFKPFVPRLSVREGFLALTSTDGNKIKLIWSSFISKLQADYILHISTTEALFTLLDLANDFYLEPCGCRLPVIYVTLYSQLAPDINESAGESCHNGGANAKDSVGLRNTPNPISSGTRVGMKEGYRQEP